MLSWCKLALPYANRRTGKHLCNLHHTILNQTNQTNQPNQYINNSVIVTIVIVFVW